MRLTSKWRGFAVRVVVAGVAMLAGCCCVGVPVAGALSASFAGGGSLAGQVSFPGGVAVDQENGDVYIADRGNNRIDVFSSEGEFLRAWGWGVADGETAALQTCTSTCFKGLAGSGAGELSKVEGIAVDNDPLSASHGDVYVVDTGNHRVQKFTPEGAFMLMLGGEVNAGTHGNLCLAGETCQAGVAGTGTGAFEELAGHSVAVSADGTLFVGDKNRVQRLSPEGVWEGSVSFPGTPALGVVTSLAVTSGGDLYIQGSGRSGVREYEASGVEVPPVRDSTGLKERQAIALGPAEGLFVNDLRAVGKTFSHHIFAYDAAGAQTASFDAGPEALDGQQGIAYSETVGALYVLNEYSVRVVVPPPPGPLVPAGSESASEISPTGARLCAAVNSEGSSPTSYLFEYGESEAYGQSTPSTPLKGGAFEDQSACATVTGLSAAATVHFRVVVENSEGETASGPDQTFVTLPPVSIEATSVVEVDDTSTRLQAELNPHGLPSEYRFEYGPTTAYGASVPIPDGSAGSSSIDTTVEDSIQGLSPSSVYHYRVVAHNALGTITGPDRVFATQGTGTGLLDGRVWEQVSPQDKHGAPLEPLTQEGGLIQAASDGGAFAFVALGPTDTGAPGVRSPYDTQLFAKRTADGWRTQDIATPHEEISKIKPGVSSEYRQFSEDLSAGIVEPEGVTPLSTSTTERTPYRAEPGASDCPDRSAIVPSNICYQPLVTAANVLVGTKFGGEEEEGSGQWGGGVEFLTANPDLSHVVLQSTHVLASGFKPGVKQSESSLYEWTDGRLQLVSVLPNKEPAAEAKLAVSAGFNNQDMRGAVSANGERVFFETVGPVHLYVRDMGLGQTLQLDVPQAGAEGGLGEPVFQSASSDGNKVFFTDEARLTRDATARAGGGPDLYMCEVTVSGEGRLSCALSDLSVDPNPGEVANLPYGGLVAGIDTTGEHVYFVAGGVLTSVPNARSEHALPGRCQARRIELKQEEKGEGESLCNLYVYDTVLHKIALVAVLSSGDAQDWASLLVDLTAGSSPDGRYFAFMSRRGLTGYDNRDAQSGQPDEEVFLFDSQTGVLRCVSCDPSGARPHGVFDTSAYPGLLVDRRESWEGAWLAGSLPGWTANQVGVGLYQSRYLSDSGRLFFNSPDGLVSHDTNGAMDVYEYEPPGVGDCTTGSVTFSLVSSGCVGLISSGVSREESAFLDASESGDDVFFLTAARLAKSDVDSAFDVYDAHVCNTASPCPASSEATSACEGDSCQSPSQAPSDRTPASLTYKGPGNVVAPAPSAPVASSKPKSLTRAQRLAAALRACHKKHNKRKRQACERVARGKYGPAAEKAVRRTGEKS